MAASAFSRLCSSSNEMRRDRPANRRPSRSAAQVGGSSPQPLADICPITYQPRHPPDNDEWRLTDGIRRSVQAGFLPLSSSNTTATTVKRLAVGRLPSNSGKWLLHSYPQAFICRRSNRGIGWVVNDRFPPKNAPPPSRRDLRARELASTPDGTTHHRGIR
uniref:Uncharacterized protein n=1 Tax=Plectus sambesii TaxID=2011161 RepID=A0A914VED4_9BILA